MTFRKRFCGFTLIELMVVVGIIAVLIAILLPALNRARQISRSVTCLANMRDTANTVAVYLANNKGALDVTQITWGGTGTCPVMADYIDPGEEIGSGSSGIKNVSGTLATATYGWNCWITAIASSNPIRGSSPTVSVYTKPGSIKDTSEVVLAGDVVATNNGGGFNTTGGGNGSIYDPFALFQNGYMTLSLYTPDFHGRHGGRGAILWMDGHASLETATPVPSYATKVAGRGFYNNNHIGYLVRNASDLASISAMYYFVYRKDALSMSYASMALTDPAKGLWQ